MKKLLLSILSLLIFIFSPQTVIAQEEQIPSSGLDEISSDIDLFLGRGASGYLLWQYSGPASDPSENDPYSFFQGGSVCDLLQEKANQYPGKFIGVNMHSLAKHDPGYIGNTLDYLATQCGTSVIRIWGTPDRGGAAAIKKVLNLAQTRNIDVIVVLADYSNSTEPILPGSIVTNPTNWYSSQYQLLYLPYVRETVSEIGNHPALYGYELANEPHCSTIQTCVNPYFGWAEVVSRAIKSINPSTNVGIGQKANEDVSLGDSPGKGHFFDSNAPSTITITSAHFYTTGEKESALVALDLSQRLGKPFYIGEAGTKIREEEPPAEGEFTLEQIACRDTTNPEFHSLRPYPASACLNEIEETALFCGNDLITKNKLQEFANRNNCGLEEPEDFRAGEYVRCTFEQNELKTPVRIDLTSAEFPIAGNTELVPNSTNPINPDDKGLMSSFLSLAQRMTEYVSWYLNGAIFRAEEPQPEEQGELYSDVERSQTPEETPPPEPPTPNDINAVLALGDSITAGKFYPSYLCNLQSAFSNFEFVGDEVVDETVNIGCNVNHEAFGGIDTSGMLARSTQWAFEDADAVLIHLGVNDMTVSGDNSNSAFANLQSIIGVLRQNNPNVAIFIAQIIPVQGAPTAGVNPEITSLNSYIASLADSNPESPVIVVDANTGFADSFYRDSVHPNQDGANFIASRFEAAINNYLAGNLESTQGPEAITFMETAQDPLINLSGPLRKLLPKFLQRQYREDQQKDADEVRHDQIVACGPLNNPRPCYTDEQPTVRRLTRVPAEGRTASNYIPYSSTEDRVGESLLHTEEELLQLIVDDEGNSYLTSIQPPEGQEGQEVQISSVKFIETDENLDDYRTRDELYFAHTQEDVELANILQGTFAPGGADWFSGYTGLRHVDEVAAQRGSEDLTQRCEVVDTRSNPGDDLYGEAFDQADVIRGDLTYDAKFSCEYFINGGKLDECILAGGDPVSCTWDQVEEAPPCEKNSIVAMTVFTKTPKAEEMWERFVNGSFSIFKRMFPQVGADSPVEEIKDIPGVTTANYTSGAQQTLAGNPQGGRSGSSAQLFFPHLGSIYDYFLQGIQKALRPFSTAALPSGAFEEAGFTPTTPTACNQGTPDTLPEPVAQLVATGLNPMEAALQYASNTFNVPVCVLEGVMGIESGFGSHRDPTTGEVYNRVDWEAILADPELQERLMWEGNTEIACDSTSGDETLHNQCSARGPFALTTGPEGVYCENNEPRCPYSDPNYCRYSCPAYCDASGVVDRLVPNAWSGVGGASGRAGAQPTNLYDAMMAAALLLNGKAGGPNSPRWSESQIVTAGNNYYGSDQVFEGLSNLSYGQAVNAYCKGQYPSLFP